MRTCQLDFELFWTLNELLELDDCLVAGECC